MPKYRIAETLRVEFIIEDENAKQAVDKYMSEFMRTFTADKAIQVQEGTDFTTNIVNENGSIGEEIDPYYD